MSHTGTAGLPRPGPYLPGLNEEGKGVIEAIPGQPRAARSSARTFSPHMTRPVSVKP